MKDINYDEVLDKWYDKVIEKADKYNEKADEYELGSVDYYKFKNYSNGLYMALSMLSLEERKAKRKLNKANYKDLLLITISKNILNGNYKVDDELKKIARKYIKRKRLTRIEMEYLVSFVYSKNNKVNITEILQNY